MRIGISGAHGTGKTTLVEALCGRMPDHTAVDEPYYLLEEEGYEFEYPPSVQDYRAQLARSVLALRSPVDRLVFDRTPLDFLAYLSAQGVDFESAADPTSLQLVLTSLDLLVITPITPETEQVLPTAELLRLREAMNGALLDLLYDDPLKLWGEVPVIELNGPLDQRLETVLTALPS